MLQESKDKETVELPTGGPPLCLKRVKRARKTSSKISQCYLKKRANHLKKLKQSLAGNSDNDVVHQVGAELKGMSSRIRNKIYERAGIKRRVIVGKKYGIALQHRLGISYGQMRMQRRFMRKLGVIFESEKSQRKLLPTLIPIDLFTISDQLFHFKDDMNQPFTKTTPMLHVNNLTKLTHTLLDGYKRHGYLTWHDQIPESEIWVKIGGDHGKDSFKLNLQVLNVEHPNSKLMTVMIGMVPQVKDTYKNLEIFFQVFQEQINILNKSTWEDKKIKVFFFGDYSFLASIFGLSGATGKYPCLWCHKSTDEIQKQIHIQPLTSPRTLHSLKSNYENYRILGKNQKKNAAIHMNVINKNLVDIELKNVSPPSLHILLGIVKKHHTLLENECDTIDKEIAHGLAEKGTKQIGLYGNYVEELKIIKDEITQKGGERILIDEIPGNLDQIQVLEETLDSFYDKMERLEKKFPERQGPVCSGLDKSLKKHNIALQAYHGRSLIGNHCKKYIQPSVHKDITRQLVRRTTESTNDVSIQIKAAVIKQKFDHLNELYSKVHSLISHSRPITTETHRIIETSIQKYCRFYRTAFKKRVYPKMHFLEDHCLQWIKLYGFGLGLFSEQGGEQLHKTISELERQTQSIKRTSDRLLSILKKHLTQVCPDIFIEEPQPHECAHPERKHIKALVGLGDRLKMVI
ncbi:amine oxidase [Plakobranchus ocellatus]|uniref:Amine oxidase n=1 Tax=Plakobranchus ocellatus TaxID=259542 RepID=A0AAV4B558_9GAST|nr:amine oxidase [Plakobranchus ocellatus]